MMGKTTGTTLPSFWLNAREEMRARDWKLNETAYMQIEQVFQQHYAAGDSSPAEVTSEYDKEEFLLVVDGQGQATGTAQSILERLQETVSAHPPFTAWLRETRLPDGHPVLLAARWLCHLVGLRHRTVEIFIDPPHIEGHTLIQVRGMEKFEAPGAFDIPCAGHINETDSAEASLVKELSEELDLTLDNLSEIRRLSQYNSYSGGGLNLSANHEFRILYRAKLKSSAARLIRFKDGEVAGLAVFSVPELRELVNRYPERIASGLSDALVYYV